MSNHRRPSSPRHRARRRSRSPASARKPAFENEPTAVPSQRAQARLAAAGLHPRLIPRDSSEPVTALRPVPERFPSFAAGTPPSTRTGEIVVPAAHPPPQDFDDLATTVRGDSWGMPVRARMRRAPDEPPSIPVMRRPSRARPKPRVRPLPRRAEPLPPRVKPLPARAEPRPPRVKPLPPRAEPLLPPRVEPVPPPRVEPVSPPRPAPVQQARPASKPKPRARPASTPKRQARPAWKQQAKTAKAITGTPVADAAQLRPEARRVESVRTLMTIPADKAAAAAAARAAGETAPGRGGWLLAAIAGVCCAIAWTIGPLALGIALDDPRVAAGALAAPVLAPLLGTMLMAAILRARGLRGWRSITGLFMLAIAGFAAAWAVRLAGPVVFELGPPGIAADPAQAWIAVRDNVLGALDLLTTPRLVAAWGTEALLVLAMAAMCARRRRGAGGD